MAAGMGIGAGVSALGSLIGGQNTANSLNAQANLQIENAQEAESQGAFDAMKSQIQSSNKISQNVANYAASGVTSSSGSAMAVLTASASNAELDRLNILHGADVKAISYENQASMERAGAGQAVTGSLFTALGMGTVAGSKIGANSMSAVPSSGSDALAGDSSVANIESVS